MGLRITLAEISASDGWQGSTGLFEDAARALASLGHDVRWIDDGAITRSAQPTPLLTALNRGMAARQMVSSHQLAHMLSEQPPDLIIAPLRGGLAQASLMARACGEAFLNTRIALWCNQPTRDRYLAGDWPETDLSPLIADAMERQCLSMADALVLPDAETSTLSFHGLNHHPTLVTCRRLKRPPIVPRDAAKITEIVFIGALRRSAGAGEFIEAIEQLARYGAIGDRLVTFIGPMNGSAYGLGKDWLGQKAMGWPFRFRIVDEPQREKALRYVGEAGRLAVVVSPDGEYLRSLGGVGGAHIAVRGQPMRNPRLAASLAERITAALEGGANEPADRTVDWERLLTDLTAPQPRRVPSTTASIAVCILHHNRLEYLRQALESIPHKIAGQNVEIVVIDNASPIADIERRIHEAAGDRPSLRLVCLSEPLPQAAAYNRGLAEARSSIVVFLDDDNAFTVGGLERLARAASAGTHDIVVTALDIFEGKDAASAPSVGRLVFLGAAHSAGLFFNAFGDTAMAVRRESFLANGGFHELGYDYPSLDWVCLAKAQSTGLRIGALQWPAVRYRRDTVRADVQAIKLDEAGARALVFDAYRGSFDAALLSRYAQLLQLSDL